MKMVRYKGVEVLCFESEKEKQSHISNLQAMDKGCLYYAMGPDDIAESTFTAAIAAAKRYIANPTAVSVPSRYTHVRSLFSYIRCMLKGHPEDRLAVMKCTERITHIDRGEVKFTKSEPSEGVNCLDCGTFLGYAEDGEDMIKQLRGGKRQ